MTDTRPFADPAPDASGAATSVMSHRIAEHLREQILSGELKPGARIRQEEVAREFGASRLPVREALRILHSQGLVTLKANSGAWVSEMNAEECDVTYKIRERLEPLALTESIPHLSADTVRRLEEIQDEIEANTSLDRFLHLDRELHLLSYSGNPYKELRDMIERLWNITQPYRRAYVERAGHQRSWVINAEHRLLIDAIRRADTTDAERLLAGHIRRTRIALLPVIERNSTGR
ncbi:GntR family transcriptional regulator [Acrocarpospora macrocephala]|uniref:GntR family transcriptional regulator n=1 Tax=Acrocarpospora macrocephala TaxID=150177 RepID=A0A5M3WLQ6_9ACTN|nr:GntR family transcriptional regulator [Acrocarpospora macrocephala]GES10205.1 GntR family transcriptional regulator [Acrocarpospora macrocephala]